MQKTLWVQHLQALAARERAEQLHPNEVEALLMSDDPNKTGLDRKLIALEEPHEVQSWTQSLGCTKAELEAAVKAVGHSAERVRVYLAKQR